MVNTPKGTTSQPSAFESRLIEMGVFSSPHGVRGQIKLRSFTEFPEDIVSYSPLLDKQGNSYSLTIEGEAGDMLIVSVAGFGDRNSAEKLKNIKLYTPRTSLPKLQKGEYYHEDLIGLSIFTRDGHPFGEILSVHDFGAGTLVNIRLISGNEEYMPFNPTVFPEVDIVMRRAVIDPPFIMKDDGPNE